MAVSIAVAPLLLLLHGMPRAMAAPARATVRVFAAASLSGAFDDVARAFGQQHPGVTVQLNLAGSQQLASQIDQGAAADLFASADERWMAYLRDRDLLAGSPSIFARNRLVAILPTSNPAGIRGLRDLSRPGIKLVIGGEAVPVGHYTRTVLMNLSRNPAFGSSYSERVLVNVVSHEENVKSIVGKVQLGEADAGFVYRSDVTPAVARRIRVIEIPEAANVIASYPIAVMRGAAHPREAAAFVDFVLSARGQHILERWGFIPVASAGH